MLKQLTSLESILTGLLTFAILIAKSAALPAQDHSLWQTGLTAGACSMAARWLVGRAIARRALDQEHYG